MRDFLDGQIEGLSIESSGRLSLAPQTTLSLDLGTPAVWSIATDQAGVIYAGTGNDGKILKIDNRTTETFYDAPEPEVQALVFGPDGRLFAATNPEGKVYAIDKTGKSTVLKLALDELGLSPHRSDRNSVVQASAYTSRTTVADVASTAPYG